MLNSLALVLTLNQIVKTFSDVDYHQDLVLIAKTEKQLDTLFAKYKNVSVKLTIVEYAGRVGFINLELDGSFLYVGNYSN